MYAVNTKRRCVAWNAKKRCMLYLLAWQNERVRQRSRWDVSADWLEKGKAAPNRGLAQLSSERRSEIAKQGAAKR